MRIAFVRLSSPVELNLSTASTNILGTELRVGLLKSLIDKGHQVTIYSGIKNSDLSMIKSSGFFGDNWFSKLKYEPLKLPTDEDILLIECGTDNSVFCYHINGQEISYIKRTFDCIHNFRGHVVYYQHGCLQFPFRIYKVSNSTSDLNISNLNKKTNLFGDKDWVIWHHFTNFENFQKRESYRYDLYPGKFRFKFTMVPYSDIEPWFPVKEKPEYDSLFIGSQWDSRSTQAGFERSEEILSLYDIEGLNTAIIGKWEPDKTKKFKFVKYLGQVGSHGDAYKLWNNSYTCIYTTSSFIRTCGLLPSRLTMANRGGSIILADEQLNCAKTIVDDEWIVSNKEDVKKKINHIKTLSVEERDSIRKKQLSRYPKWDNINIDDIIR